MAAAETLIAIIERRGGRATVTSTQGSIITEFETPNGVLYPFGIVQWSKGAIQFNLAYLASRSAFADEAVRKGLYDRLVKIVSSLSTSNMKGFPMFPLILMNDPVIAAEIDTFIEELLRLAGAAGE